MVEWKSQDIGAAENISALFEELNGTIGLLDAQVGQILNEHEKEFLTAYRVHMFAIQKELKLLKMSISHEELKRRRDEEILAREKERDWFRDEALRLDRICKEYMKSAEMWKSKAKMLEQDKKVLEEKLQQLSHREPKKSETKSVSPMKSSVSLHKSFITESAVTIKTQNNQNVEGTISHLHNEIKFYKNWVKKLRAETNGIINRKHQLENLFQDCVELAKEDVKRSNESLSVSEIVGNGFEAVNEAEKRKILYTLISKPEVTELVKNFIFHSKRQSTPTQGIMKVSISSHGLSSHVFSTPKKHPRLRHFPYYKHES
jgi:hypothetical protein